MHFVQRIQFYKWEVIGFFLLALVVLVNVFPTGYIILGADILQPIHMAEHYVHFHYEWLGRVSLFYGIFYFLDSLGISDTAQISWYLGIFLFASYFSFLSFCSILFPQSTRLARVVTALFYATNLYTLYIFTATWGYTHYQIVYAFLPVVTGLYIRSLEKKGAIDIVSLLIVVFLCSSSYGNPAFALSFGIYFFFLTLALFLFRIVDFSKGTVKSLVAIIFGAFLVNIYWILPLLPQLRGGIAGVYSSEFVDLTERLAKTSNAIFDTIRLLPTSEQNRYFPTNFPYTRIAWLKQPLLGLAFLPFFIALIGWIQRRYLSSREQRLYTVFLSVFVVFTVLVARVRFPFETLNSFLFQLPGLNTLRGWDKLATITPFLLSVLILLFFISIQAKRYARIIFGGFFLLLIVLALPFYVGGLQTKMSYILSGQKVKDFRSAKQSALVKIPDAYESIAPLLNADPSESKISMLPYSPGSSVGRVNLPTWKVNGPHPANSLYNKKYIELYNDYLPGWIFAKDFEKTEYDPKWITELYGLLGIKYIFYHKDAKVESIESLVTAKSYLEQSGQINKISDNDSFSLYQLNEAYLFPYLYTAPVAPVVPFSPQGLVLVVEHLRAEITPLQYERINPMKVVFKVTGSLPAGTALFLNEKYDPLWRAEYISSDGKHSPLQRDTGIQYANVWKVGENLSAGRVEVYYMPINLLSFGEWVSGVSLLLLFGMGWILRRRGSKIYM